MTTLFENLLDQSTELIKQYLPEDHEIDDVAWDPNSDLFQIPVFDVSTIESSMRGPVDRFRFYRMSWETDDEVVERWQREIDEFNHSWGC